MINFGPCNPVLMARDIPQSERHKRSYLTNELESLGLAAIRLNEFNNARELGGLVSGIKASLLKEYHDSHQGLSEVKHSA